MPTLDFEPLIISVPLREEPPGVFRVGDSRVLWNWCSTPSDTARRRGDRQVVSHAPAGRRLRGHRSDLADPAPFDEYLRRCDEEAAVVRREMDAASMTGGVGNEELLNCAWSKGLIA